MQAIIFDVDGTLAETERDAHRVAFNLAFEQAGLDWHWSDELYKQLLDVTGGKERIRYYLNDFNSEYLNPSPFKDDQQLQEFIAELHQAKTGFYKDLMNQGKVPLRNGVKRLMLEAKAQNIRLAIATTTTPANVTALLNNTLGKGSEDWFDVIAAGDVVPNKKPAGDIYFYALQHLGLSAEQCLALEDSENGLRSSLEAGIKTVITLNDYTAEQDFTGASLVIDDLGEPDKEFSIVACDFADKSELAKQYSYFNLELAQQLMQAS